MKQESTQAVVPGSEMFKGGKNLEKITQLGRLITEPQGRDAVHIAVAPVTAGETLRPGDRIGFTGNAHTVGKDADIIGIVDPFLLRAVMKGDQFYMFLLPNTITSLRHEWTHPAFEKEDEIATYEPTFMKLRGPTAEQEWVSEFANRINTNYEDLMAAAKKYLETGEYFCQGGDFEGEYISEEFWDKYEAITNEESGDRGSFLTCSC